MPRLRSQGSHTRSLQWSADGRTLVYQAWSYTKAVTDGAARVIQTGARIEISQILADGSGLGTEDRGTAVLWRIDLEAARVEPEKVRSIPWTDDDLSVSPDGQWLAFSTARNGPTQIWVSRLDGSDARADLRDSSIRSVWRQNGRGRRELVAGRKMDRDGDAAGDRARRHKRKDSYRSYAGGRLRSVVDCRSIGSAPVWTGDGKALYIVKYSQDYKASYFLADIATGSLTPIAEETVPKLPPVPLPEGSGQQHVAQGGRFLYYEAPVNWKPRLVRLEGLVPK